MLSHIYNNCNVKYSPKQKTIALAIAFGVGGRTIASNRLRKLEKIAESNVEPNDEPEYPLNRSQ